MKQWMVRLRRNGKDMPAGLVEAADRQTAIQAAQKKYREYEIAGVVEMNMEMVARTLKSYLGEDA